MAFSGIPLPKVVADTEPGGGIVSAMNALANLRKQQLANQYYGPNIQSEIGHRNALTQGQNIENQYMPEKLQLANAHQALQNQYYAPNILSEIGLRNANAANTRAETGYIPTKYEIQQRNSLTNMGRLTNEISNSFRAWSQTPEGQQIIKNRPDIANAMLTKIEQQAGLATGNAINENPSYQSQNQPSQQQNFMPEQSMRNNENINRDQLIKDIQKGAADSYERQNLPADTKKRLYAGNRFKSTVPFLLKNFDIAKQYFSPTGRAKWLDDERKAATDKRVPPELMAMRNVIKGLETMKVQGAFLEGVPADQISRGAYNKVWDIDKFFNSPEDALVSLKNAINLGLMADEANRASLSDLKVDTGKDKEIKQMLGEEYYPNEDKGSKDKKVIKVVFDANNKLVVEGK